MNNQKNSIRMMLVIALAVMIAVFSAACGSKTASSDTAETAAETTEETAEETAAAAVPDTLADTTWTADLGEDYGAAVQGDEGEEAPTTLTLHFTDTSAFNVVGDVSFDYALNEDGTITVSNLNLGETAISADVFELTYENGTLVLNTRINGGNATVTFEQE